MGNSYFQFKQFRVEQGMAAMKVSTDACIQGAWTPVPVNTERVLDIGTGTGLLSLMLAQRNDDITIEAVEIDVYAAQQAAANIAQSPWADRITVHHADARQLLFTGRYHMVICNPPFFNNSLLGDDDKRNTVRHALSLSFNDLMQVIKKVLQPHGVASVMLPVAEHSIWERLVQQYGWHIHHKLYIRPRTNMNPNRVISLCSATKQEVCEEQLTIYAADGGYTPEFSKLLAPYYLNL